MNIKKTKTRDLTYYQYFNQLQTEYVIIELRKKIYPSQKDKAYYQRVMEGKRKIIEDLALRNNLKSIFNCEDVKIEKYKEIYIDNFPKFSYKDEAERENLEYKDKVFYYMKGAEFRLIKGETEEIVSLIYAFFKSFTAKVMHQDGKTEIVSLNQIIRIL